MRDSRTVRASNASVKSATNHGWEQGSAEEGEGEEDHRGGEPNRDRAVARGTLVHPVHEGDTGQVEGDAAGQHQPRSEIVAGGSRGGERVGHFSCRRGLDGELRSTPKAAIPA